MIKGIGMDIVETARVQKAMQNPRFAQRVFTSGERAQLQHGPQERAAGFFAAKEACVKALGTGFAGIRWQDIEVSHLHSGAPVLILTGNALLQQKKLGVAKVWVNITHIKDLAAAQVVLEDE